SSSCTSSNLRPMKRLIEKTVFCGLVTAWRFAAWPTNRSPFFEKATIDGVVRAPSLFSKTTGSPPSITAMQELVVPKSIPKTLAICVQSSDTLQQRLFHLLKANRKQLSHKGLSMEWQECSLD